MGGSAVTGCRSQPSALPGSGRKTRDRQSPPHRRGVTRHGRDSMREGAALQRQARCCPRAPGTASPRPHCQHRAYGTICYVFAQGSSAAASPRCNHVNDPRIRAGKIRCPCSALLRAKTRAWLPRMLGQWRKPPHPPPASPVPQESGKLRYGNGHKAHPLQVPRRELRPILNPPCGARASGAGGQLPREILSANSRLKA